MFFAILFSIHSLAVLRNNELSHLRIGRKYAVIPNEIVARSGHQRCKLAKKIQEDYELGSKQIKKGDKVIMWYLSGNRDESVFEDAEKMIIDRPNARSHVAFGFGVHRCMGNRLAEMQLRILWEEIVKRFDKVEVVGEVERLPNNFIRGIKDVPVILHPA